MAAGLRDRAGYSVGVHPIVVNRPRCSTNRHGHPPRREAGHPRPRFMLAKANRVLVVEHDELLLAQLKKLLPGPYRLEVVRTIAEADEEMARSSSAHAGIITDANPSGRGGVEWFQEVRDYGWVGRRLVTSTSDDEELMLRAASAESAFVHKRGDSRHTAACLRSWLHKVMIDDKIGRLLRSYGAEFNLTPRGAAHTRPRAVG